MSRLPLSISSRAERETLEAARWYEGESPGLGAAFLEIVEKTLDAVVEAPLRFPLLHRDVRRALLKRFPYGVFFRVQPHRIRVISILHLARDPARWQQRR